MEGVADALPDSGVGGGCDGVERGAAGEREAEVSGEHGVSLDDQVEAPVAGDHAPQPLALEGRRTLVVVHEPPHR
jgi:hypothetical protein